MQHDRNKLALFVINSLTGRLLLPLLLNPLCDVRHLLNYSRVQIQHATDDQNQNDQQAAAAPKAIFGETRRRSSTLLL